MKIIPICDKCDQQMTDYGDDDRYNWICESCDIKDKWGIFRVQTVEILERCKQGEHPEIERGVCLCCGYLV